MSSRHFPAIDFKMRFPALDGIRALAVTMVFLDHYAGGSHGGTLLRVVNLLRERMWVGVDLFFVLSGFLITGILYDTRADSQYFRRFFARRSLRIFPIFYLVVAIHLLLTLVFHFAWRPAHLWFLVYMGNWPANADFSLYEVWSRSHPHVNLFIGHLWSLCVEEQFYLLWPLVVWLVRDRVRLLRVCFGLSAASLALRWFWCLHYADAGRWIIRTLPFRLDTLLLGAAVALLLRGPNAERYQRACRWLFLAALTACLYIFFKPYPPGNATLVLTLGLTAVALASAGLIGMTLRTGSPAFRLFLLRPLRLLGKYSYGFYILAFLWQWEWIQLLVKVTAAVHSIAIAGLLTIPFNFLVTFFIAKLSYDFFEVRFLRYKRHFEYDAEQAEHQHAFTTK